MSIEVKNIDKHFGAFHVLRNVSLRVEAGELVALLGPSGSGKTTLLRVIAGLERQDRGQVWHHDDDVSGQPVRDRNVGFVFQHFALFGHLDVFENIAFALRVRKRPDAEVRARVEELLHLVQLGGYEHRMPAQLSGGQRQRVALARALAARPKVLLLDEPFSALDAQVRKDLRAWLRKLHEEVRTTCLFVTHDQEEAFELADRVVLFRDGGIEQVGTPAQLYGEPASAFVMQFLGHVQMLAGAVQGDEWRSQDGSLHLRVPAGVVPGPTQAALRHHDLDLLPPTATEGWPAQVERLTTSGPRRTVTLRVGASALPLRVELFGEHGPAPQAGDPVRVWPRQVRFWAAAQ
ncbi:MAG: sulfate/molybdate ABC transporter ATP-binding protein [Deltaproteobacteria bacterium]|nr:sulfate/molybdate ABC transporter ATP-binding protein [Deltaproteobacteria bacterium]